MNNKIKIELLKKNYIPYFQPIMAKNEVMYECLARIKVEDKIFYPLDFLSFTKEMGLYEDLTKTMIEKSCKYFANRDISFSINLGYNDFLNDRTMSFIKENILKYKIGKRLIIEILEEEIIDIKIVQDFINEFRTYGVRIALDDFGVAASNIHHLINFAPDYIKLDGFFIQDILTDPKITIIIKNIVSLAKELGIKTIMEYTKSDEIYQVLKTLNIDYFQGFYFGKPSAEILDQNNNTFYESPHSIKGLL